MKYLYIGILVFLTGHVFAQTTALDTTQLVIETYQLTEVTSKLQETNDLILQAEAFYNDKKGLEEAQTQIARLDSTWKVHRIKADTVSSTVTEIRSLINVFNLYLTSYEEIENDLNDQTQDFDEFRKQIKDLQIKWQATFESLESDNSATVLSLIDDVRKRLDNTDQLLVDQIDQIFKAQNTINIQRSEIQQLSNMLNIWEVSQGKEIFETDSRPIWALNQDSIAFETIIDQLVINGSASLEETKQFAKQNRVLIISNITFIILLMILIIYLKRKQQQFESVDDQPELWILFNHPVGLSILLGLLVFIPGYGLLPESTRDILILLIYFIVLNLLFPILNRRVKILLLILAIFLTFNTGLQFMTNYYITARIGLLFESILGIYLVYAIMKPGLKSYNYFNIPMARWMVYMIPLSFIPFGLSAITNILGASLFSEFLLYSTTRSMANAVIIFAGVLALNGMITLVLRTTWANTVYVIKEYSALIENRTKQLLSIGMFAFLLVRLFEEFNAWDEVVFLFNSILDFDIVFGKLEMTLRGLIAFFMTIIISWWLATLIRLILEKELFQRLRMPRGIPGAISSTIFFVIVSIGFFLALSQAGVNLGQISIVIGALGVGIGFGLQNVIANFISGIILAFERPIREGDTVEVGELTGEVKSIGIRASKVLTWDGSEVIVPNSNLISKEVVNWTLSDRKRRSTIKVGVAYGNDPKVVSEILRKEALDHPKSLKVPEPLVIFVGFGDSSIDFKLHFWTYFEDGYVSKSEVTMNIYHALSKAGIEIPFPQRVVSMKEAPIKNDLKDTLIKGDEKPDTNESAGK